jgi:hypothetical protein
MTKGLISSPGISAGEQKDTGAETTVEETMYKIFAELRKTTIYRIKNSLQSHSR